MSAFQFKKLKLALLLASLGCAMICPKRTQILFPSREGRKKKSADYKKQTKAKELTKMLKMMYM